MRAGRGFLTPRRERSMTQPQAFSLRLSLCRRNDPQSKSASHFPHFARLSAASLNTLSGLLGKMNVPSVVERVWPWRRANLVMAALSFRHVAACSLLTSSAVCLTCCGEVLKGGDKCD